MPMHWTPAYEYSQHRRVSSLDTWRAPDTATHTAKLPNGVMYFVRHDGKTWWIVGSDQYGKGYAGSSLYAKDVVFVVLANAIA